MTVFVLAMTAVVLSKPALADAPSSSRGLRCYSAAAEAAEREYGKYYQADWYIHLQAVVTKRQVRTVEIHVGPYDGSLGGGISARFACDTGKLTFVEQER